MKKFGNAALKKSGEDETREELGRVKAELRRVTEERDILKKAATYFAKATE